MGGGKHQGFSVETQQEEWKRKKCPPSEGKVELEQFSKKEDVKKKGHSGGA